MWSATESVMPQLLYNMLRRNRRNIGKLLFFAILGNLILIQMYHLQPPPYDSTSLSTRLVLHNGINRDVHAPSRGVNLSEKIDWNNYTLMDLDRLRVGPGEHGKAFNLELSDKERKEADFLYNKHQFNAMASSRISYQRSIGDQRDEMCQKANFSKHIPLNSVSVVIPFYNEHSSTVLRTVFSIVNRTPSKLLREIILVDDFSSSPELKSPLDEYFVKNNMSKVRVLRNKRRLGLISSRMAGADASTGRFIVFLDSHMEVNYNFLPPLIEPILFDYKTVTCPVVDNINRYNFQIVKIDYERNAFQWNLRNEHFKIFPNDAKNLPSPFPTPVMMGGAFVIDRKWWNTIGKYDPGLEVWGGEQYEISFKIWMCGGKLLNVPCSRVAHLFRHKLPYPVGDIYSRNLKRVVSVWMDDYREYVYRRLPGVRDADPGDLTSRIELRQKLQCRDFDWYMKNVAFDILYNYPVIEPPILARGALRPKSKPDYCVKLSPKGQKFDSVFVDKCVRDATDFKFEFSWRKSIIERNGIRCLETRQKETVSVHYLRLNATVQQFVWERLKGWMVSVDNGNCLHYDQSKKGVDMKQCQDDPSFSWMFDDYNASLVDAEWEKYRRVLHVRGRGLNR